MRKSTLAWARKYFEMDYGRFDPERHRPVVDILRTLDRRMGCKFIIVANAQSFKTLAVTIWVIAALMLRSAKAGWYSKSRDSVEAFVDEKFNASFDENPSIRRLRPHDSNRITKLVKRLPHVILQFLSAGTQLDRQQKTLATVVMDEWWTYEAGWIKEIENRYSSHPHTFREIMPSTGGDVGTEAEEIWKESDQRTWHLRCPHCRELFNPVFFVAKPIPVAERKDDRGEPLTIEGLPMWRPWGGLHFQTGEGIRQLDGTIDWQALHASVYYECPRCGQHIRYTPKALQEMDDGGDYVPLNPHPKRDVVGWHANALRQLAWTQLAEEWIKAIAALRHGDPEPIEVFWKTRLALFWDIRYTLQNEAKGHSFGDYAFDAPIPEDWLPLMLVDVQQDHFWVVVRAFSRHAKSRLIWCGRVLSEGHLREIQKRYGVRDHGGNIAYDPVSRVHVLPAGCGVYLDGNYNPTYVRRLAATYHWCVLRGEDSKRFLHPDGKYRIYDVIRPVESFEGTITQGDRYVAEIKFANDDARNTFATLRGIGDPERLWTYPKDIAEKCADYLKHLDAWVRVPKKRAKDNSYFFEWRKTSEGARDDLFWCEKAAIVVASMAGLIGAAAAGVETPGPAPDTASPA